MKEAKRLHNTSYIKKKENKERERERGKKPGWRSCSFGSDVARVGSGEIGERAQSIAGSLGQVCIAQIRSAVQRYSGKQITFTTRAVKKQPVITGETGFVFLFFFYLFECQEK